MAMPDDQQPRGPRIRHRCFATQEQRIDEYPISQDPFELIEKVVVPELGLSGPEDAQRNERYEAVMASRRQQHAAANDVQPTGKRRRFNRYKTLV